MRTKMINEINQKLFYKKKKLPIPNIKTLCDKYTWESLLCVDEYTWESCLPCVFGTWGFFSFKINFDAGAKYVHQEVKTSQYLHYQEVGLSGVLTPGV